MDVPKRFLGCLCILVLTISCGKSDDDEDPTNDSSSAGVQVGSQSIGLNITFISTPSESSSDAAVVFEFTSSAANKFKCALDDQKEVECKSPHTVVPLEIGTHNISIVGSDGNGNSGAPATFSWEQTSLFAVDHEELIQTTQMPSAVDEEGWRGIFRINCDFSHTSYNDPIVHFESEGVAHLHRFYGNMSVNHATDTASLYGNPESTCQGNTINSTAYWIPALLAPEFDGQTGARKVDGNGEPAWEVVEAVVGDDDVAHELFYYSAGIDDLNAIEVPPPGLRIIAGDNSVTPSKTAQSTSIVRWHCQSWESSDGANPNWSTTIPECVYPDRVRLDIFFPNCWDGENLDSEDHKSHMAYPVNNGGPNGTVCPETHPVPLLRASYHYAFPVLPGNSDPVTNSSKGWRLASDSYDVVGNNGGLSIHGDWFNAWHPEILNAIVENCIKKRLDCHDGNLANGFRLSGTTKGEQNSEVIINQGLGSGMTPH